MNDKARLTSVLFKICILIVLTMLSLGLFLTQKALLDIDAKLKQYEPILKQIKQIQDEVESNSGLDSASSQEISIYLFAYQASYHESPLSFKLACIKQESSFNPYVVGPCNEHGLTQIYYPTWLSCQAKGDYHNWHDTLLFGYQLMDDCWTVARGNAKLAAMFYNGGPMILRRSSRAISMASRHGRRVNQYYEQYLGTYDNNLSSTL